MINKIQALISELEAEKSKADGVLLIAFKSRDTALRFRMEGKQDAFDLCIQKLTQILNEETVKDVPKCNCVRCSIDGYKKTWTPGRM